MQRLQNQHEHQTFNHNYRKMRTVASYPLFSDNLVAEVSTKGDHCTLSSSIIQQLRVSHYEIDASIKHDRGLVLLGLFELRHLSLGEIEERVHVGVKCGVPLIRWEGKDVGVSRLGSRG